MSDVGGGDVMVKEVRLDMGIVIEWVADDVVDSEMGKEPRPE